MFDWPLGLNIVAFLAATAVITGAGIRLSQVADRLADRTGLGEALMGALLLGGSTSLAGTVVSLTAAWQGEAQLAISNAIGGIAAQTACRGRYAAGPTWAAAGQQPGLWVLRCWVDCL